MPACSLPLAVEARGSRTIGGYGCRVYRVSSGDWWEDVCMTTNIPAMLRVFNLSALRRDGHAGLPLAFLADSSKATNSMGAEVAIQAIPNDDGLFRIPDGYKRTSATSVCSSEAGGEPRSEVASTRLRPLDGR